MSCRRISSLLSRSSVGSYLNSLASGRSSCMRRGLYRHSTDAAIEEPITPPVEVNFTKLLINGQFVDTASGKIFHTLDPRTGNVIADVAEGDAEDVNRTVSAAQKAFDNVLPPIHLICKLPREKITEEMNVLRDVLQLQSGFGKN